MARLCVGPARRGGEYEHLTSSGRRQNPHETPPRHGGRGNREYDRYATDNPNTPPLSPQVPQAPSNRASPAHAYAPPPQANIGAAVPEPPPPAASRGLWGRAFGAAQQEKEQEELRRNQVSGGDGALGALDGPPS